MLKASACFVDLFTDLHRIVHSPGACQGAAASEEVCESSASEAPYFQLLAGSQGIRWHLAHACMCFDGMSSGFCKNAMLKNGSCFACQYVYKSNGPLCLRVRCMFYSLLSVMKINACLT